MGCYAADILAEGKTNRVVGHRDGKFQDFDIEEALNMTKEIDEYQYEISRIL
jgi:6-phosphofructokinase 1